MLCSGGIKDEQGWLQEEQLRQETIRAELGQGEEIHRNRTGTTWWLTDKVKGKIKGVSGVMSSISPCWVWGAFWPSREKCPFGLDRSELRNGLYWIYGIGVPIGMRRSSEKGLGIWMFSELFQLFSTVSHNKVLRKSEMKKKMKMSRTK